jgi:nitroreductase
MEFQAVVTRRKMVRSFADRPVPAEALERILGNAQRAPSAGFSQGWAFLVLEGHGETATFWHHVAEPEWLAEPDHPGLLRAPVIILPLAHQQAYLDRYREPDKARFAPADQADWPVPYWLVDTSFATMAMLLTAVDAGLGALFFRLDRGQDALLAALGVPEGFEPIGAVALGWPDGQDHPSPSLARGRRAAESVVHRGRW